MSLEMLQLVGSCYHVHAEIEFLGFGFGIYIDCVGVMIDSVISILRPE